MHISSCPLHFGELIQYQIDDDTILISNTLKCRNTVWNSETWLTHKVILDQLIQTSVYSPYEVSMTASVDSTRGVSTPLTNKVLEYFTSNHSLSRDLLSKYAFESTSAFAVGLGLGSSTADIINLTRLITLILGREVTNTLIEDVLLFCEQASDPLYILKWCIYSSRKRVKLASLPERRSYIILGFDPFYGSKQVITEAISHPDGSLHYTDCMSKLPSTDLDLWIAENATNSLLFNNLYLDHKIPTEFFQFASIPGVGITGSHSGVMLGLLITVTGMSNIVRANKSASLIQIVHNLNLAFYCC